MEEYWIVVVDDEPLSLTNAKNMLEEENMKVSCLPSGQMLLKFVNKNTPDLILLDILMPEMDGFETYNALRRFEDENGRNHIPVIFLTGKDNIDMERRGLKAGASDFVRKPFNKEILKRRIYNTIVNSKKIESLTEEASVDKLTGFLNKASGTSRVEKMCADCSGALTIMDIDSFKLVNDLFGHDMGDRMLRAFSDILRHNTRETDVISRIGGDEFMAFFMDMNSKKAVASLTERLNRQILEAAEELMGKDHGIPLGISVGVCMIPEHGRDYESLFALADGSLYTVKQNGKHGFFIYDEKLFKSEGEELSLDEEINRITKIVSERNEGKGALLLGRESFAMIYRFIMRFYKRYGGNSVKILFEIVPTEGEESIKPAEAASQFGAILQKSLRRSDIVLQNRSNQFFVFLTERDAFDAENVLNRLLDEWKEKNDSKCFEIRYSLKCEEFKENEDAEQRSVTGEH